jgi:hypothetical protein
MSQTDDGLVTQGELARLSGADSKSIRRYEKLGMIPAGIKRLRGRAYVKLYPRDTAIDKIKWMRCQPTLVDDQTATEVLRDINAKLDRIERWIATTSRQVFKS